MNKTFAMLKPDAIEDKVTGDILKLIELNGFEILRMNKVTLSLAQAEEFYGIHQGKVFFEELIQYITSGPVILLALSKQNAVVEWRNLMGATNPANAQIGTIRRMYAQSIGRNAVHGSDSEENARKELEFFFKDLVF
jgi:nucleoside-diphosphate kinase